MFVHTSLAARRPEELVLTKEVSTLMDTHWTPHLPRLYPATYPLLGRLVRWQPT